MELPSSLCQRALHYIFSFLTILSFLVLLLYSLKHKLWCSCDHCRAYLSLSWTKQFPNLCDWYTHLLRNSPTKTIHLHAIRNIITANPDNVEYILKFRFDNYPKGKQFSSILGDFLGNGIFNVDGDMWRFQRNMCVLELDRISIRSHAFDVVKDEIDTQLIPILSSVSGKRDGVLDLQELFKGFSFASICRFSFGIDPRCLQLSIPLSEFVASFDLASELSAQRAITASPMVWKIKRMFNLGGERRLKKSINMINTLAQEVIKQRRKMGFSTRKDLLSRFMNSVNDEVYLRDIVISFLLAGRDTVASALTSLFWLLGNHPDVVSAIRVESNRVLGHNQDIRTFEQIQHLHYLQAVIYESMRLYPPVQFDSKFCVSDDKLPDGTLVKKDTRVMYHPYAMGRMETIWGSDCLEFKPDRWIRDGVFQSIKNPFKYPVFQPGIRVCLGREMAIMELKCVTVSLLRRFNVELSSVSAQSNLPRFSPGLTATFKDGLRVLIRERGIS